MKARKRGHESDKILTLETIREIAGKYEEWLATTKIPVYYVDEETLQLDPLKIVELAMNYFEKMKKE